MKQEIIYSDVQYYDPEYEAALNDIKGRLLNRVELQGAHDGAENKPRTLDEYQAIILNLIEVTLQSAIDLNQKRFLPISGGTAARQYEIEAEKKVRELQNKINDDEHSLHVLISEAKELLPDIKLMRIRKWVFVGLVFVAATEGYLSYFPFRLDQEGIFIHKINPLAYVLLNGTCSLGVILK